MFLFQVSWYEVTLEDTELWVSSSAKNAWGYSKLKRCMDFDCQLFTQSSRSPPTISTSQCQSIELATFCSYMTLIKRKEQVD